MEIVPADIQIRIKGILYNLGGPYIPDPSPKPSRVEISKLIGVATPPAAPRSHVEISSLVGVATPPVVTQLPVFGSYIPDTVNVGHDGTINGVPAGTTMTVNNTAIANVVGSTDPNNRTVINATRFTGAVFFAKFTKFTKCHFFMKPQAANSIRAAVQSASYICDPSHANYGDAIFEDCTFEIDWSNNANFPVSGLRQNGITGHRYTLTRCKFIRCSDGINISTPRLQNGTIVPAYVTIRGTYAGRCFYMSPDLDRKANGDSPPYYQNHADPLQAADAGLTDITVEYSTFEGFNDLTVGQGMNYDENREGTCLGYRPGGYSMANSAITLGVKAGHKRWRIRFNHVRGGRATVNVSGVVDSTTDVLLEGNIYDRTSQIGYPLIIPNYMRAQVRAVNEVYEDGAPVITHA